MAPFFCGTICSSWSRLAEMAFGRAQTHLVFHAPEQPDDIDLEHVSELLSSEVSKLSTVIVHSGVVDGSVNLSVGFNRLSMEALDVFFLSYV